MYILNHACQVPISLITYAILSCHFYCLFLTDITFQSSVVTFQPSSRTVSVTLNAVTDEVQEPQEVVILDFEISATIDVGKGSNSQANVTVIDNSLREFIPLARMMLPCIYIYILSCVHRVWPNSPGRRTGSGFDSR